MFKLNALAGAIALALVMPTTATAEFEVSGEVKIEYGLFTEDGTVTGASEAHDSGDAMKSEGTLKLFINSDVGEDSSFHAEILLSEEGEAASDRLEGGESYTQYDILREFYFDTSLSGWDLRLGKQQVVWGTADGIKLLDIINPTDFRELNQNAAEDSRIPVWMINAEKYFDDGSSFQFILSEAKTNFIAGLGEDGADDAGAPFMFKGVDTILGPVNGFTNIANDMGKTSGVFQTLLGMGGLTDLATGPMALTTVSGFTALGTGGANPDFNQVGTSLQAADIGGGVASMDAFGDGSNIVQFAGPISAAADANNNSLLNVVFLPFMNQLGTGNEVLNQAANTSGDLLNNFAGYMGQLQGGLATGTADGAAFTNTDTQVLDITGDGNADTDIITLAMGNLFSQMQTSVNAGLASQGVDTSDADQVAGALTQASGTTVAAADVTGVSQTYQSAVQTVAIAGMGSTFFSNSSTNQFTGELDTENPTSAFDYMGNTTFGTFDAFIGMTTEYRVKHEDETNQNIGLRYKNATESGTNYSLNFAYRYDSNPYVDMHWEDGNGNELSVNKVESQIDILGQPLDTNSDGVVDGSDLNPNPAVATVTTIKLSSGGTLADGGTAFDSQSGANPAKLIFEEKTKQITTIGASFDSAIDTDSYPVVLRGEFSLDSGVMQPVVDLDELSIGNITGALKMEESDVFKYVLGVDVTVMTNLLVSTQLIQFYNLDYLDSGNKYTGDFSSMSLTNGLKKGDEVETFVSFFLSKPFGDDGQHRWNNIFIAENDGGYWNRFDVEYGINDEMVATVELNKYWGDEDTTFGQFKTSSNVQLGLKYLF